MDWIMASKHFVLIVEQGSFAEAARKRFTTSSALSKQISWLEDRLNTTLLHRTTRHLSLTEAGQAFYTRAKKILNDIECLEKNIHADKETLRGTLRVTYPALSQQSQLLKIIPAFLAAHPELRIELIESPRQQDLAAEGIDLAIMRDYSHNTQLVQEPLGTSQSNVYGSADYFKKHGTPQTPEELVHHNCLIHSELDHQARWKFKDNKYISVSGNFSANTSAPLIEAARRGVGLIQMSDSLIACYLQDGLLIPVLQDFAQDCVGIYAVYQKTPYTNKNLVSFIEFLKTQNFCSVFCTEEISK